MIKCEYIDFDGKRVTDNYHTWHNGRCLLCDALPTSETDGYIITPTKEINNMTDQPHNPTDTMNEAQNTAPVTHAPQFTEAPYSGNVRARIAGYDWQLTIRASDSKTFLDKINGLMTWLNSNAGSAVNVDAPHAPATGAPVPPPPPTVAAPAGPMNAQCVMIEVGTSYTGNKPQLKFACNGLEHPLTFTKDVNEMAKLLAPLGFTAAHMVIGQKYPVNCIVTYTESSKDGKTYKNVQSVKAA